MGSPLQAAKPFSLRVIIFFALNPTERFTELELARKFNVPQTSVRSSLRASVTKGWLCRELAPEGFVWGAGDLLLAEL